MTIFSHVRVKRQYERGGTFPKSGMGRFILSTEMSDGTTTVPVVPVPVTLDATGHILGPDGAVGVLLEDTESANIDGVTWVLDMNIENTKQPLFPFEIPHGLSELDLSGVVPPQPGPLQYSYATLSALSAESTTRQNADSAHIAAADPHGFKGMASYLAQFMPAVYGANGVAGWYTNPLAKGGRTTGNVLNQLSLHPFYSGPIPITLDYLSCVVNTVGGAGSVCRSGIYQISNQDNPWQFSIGATWATLLKDAGTMDTATGGAGSRIFTLSPNVVIPAWTWFAIGGVDQVSIASRYISAYQISNTSMFSSGGSDCYQTYGGNSLAMTGVSGALPANFTPTGLFLLDSGVALHRVA